MLDCGTAAGPQTPAGSQAVSPRNPGNDNRVCVLRLRVERAASLHPSSHEAEWHPLPWPKLVSLTLASQNASWMTIAHTLEAAVLVIERNRAVRRGDFLPSLLPRLTVACDGPVAIRRQRRWRCWHGGPRPWSCQPFPRIAMVLGIIADKLPQDAPVGRLGLRSLRSRSTRSLTRLV